MTVDDDRKRRLEKTVTDIQKRIGLRAIGRSSDVLTPFIISTGFPILDAATGIGGLPCGRISEIVSVPTSGAATLANPSATSFRVSAPDGSIVDASTREFLADWLAAYRDWVGHFVRSTVG